MDNTAQPVNIQAPHNQGYMAARDINFQTIAQEPLTSDLKLEDVKLPEWPSPPEAARLADLVRGERLLVLAGQDLDDRGMIARHLAWLLRAKLQEEAPSLPVKVREWFRSSDPQKLELAFHETERTILLLPQIEPHQVGYRLDELQRLLTTRDHFALLTTDSPPSHWSVDDTAKMCFWRELSWKSYYGEGFLARLLLRELELVGVSLPPGLFPEGREAAGLETRLLDDISVGDVVTKLHQPDRIRSFVRWLLSQEEAVSSRQTRLQLDHLSGDRQAILGWYCQRGRTEQLLALGLSLFDGLPDDLTFSALELLVEKAWRASDPMLAHFDYRDLDGISAYFKLVEPGQPSSRVETQSSDNRQEVLAAAWRFQRRRLLLALPILTEMIKRSTGALPAGGEEGTEISPGSARQAQERTSSAIVTAAKASMDGLGGRMRGARDLYGTPRRCAQLQRALIESLSEIALLSLDDAEPWLLHLALQGSLTVQKPFAKALAAWRSRDQSQRLFLTLEGWWREGLRTGRLRSLLQKVSPQGVDPGPALRGAVALAVGYAAQYDLPNRLHPALLRMLGDLAQDRHPAVRERVLLVTLPITVAWHLNQIEGLLRHHMLTDDSTIRAIAFGIATAFELRPREALNVLDKWLTEAGGRPREVSDHQISPRERLMAAVALAYGYMKPGADPTLFTVERLLAKLREILAAETHPYVRKSVLAAVGLQLAHHFEAASPFLQELVSEVTLTDRPVLVAELTEAYVHQRSHLQGGDDVLELGEVEYPVWLYSGRPLTPIESLLFGWLEDDNLPVARQIAVQAFSRFLGTRLEHEERLFIAKRLAASQPVAPVAVDSWTWNSVKLTPVRLLGAMAVFLSAPRDRETRERLTPVLAEVIEVRHRSTPAHLESLFQRWISYPQQGLNAFIRRLRTAFDIYRFRWAVVPIALYLIWVLMGALGKLASSEPGQSVGQYDAQPYEGAAH